MDENFKMWPGSSDLAELEHDDAPRASQGCSVDLKLGGTAADSHGVRMVAAASASSSAKRLRGGGRAGGVGRRQQQQQQQQQLFPSCTVDECRADLSSCRDYHRRHKVCEAHSKTPVVTVAGRQMRFCQQCSRFQLLKEFDEAKRSCRKRLDGHNRRRRKPQQDTMNIARFMTSQQGTRFSSFPSARPEQGWQGIMGTENLYYTHQLLGISSNNRQHFVGSTSSTKGKEGWHYPFLQQAEAGGINLATTGMALLETSVCQQPLLETLLAPLESSSSKSKMFCEGLITPVLDSESDSALSLLSLSAPPHFSAAGIDDDVSQMVQQTEHIPIVQPFFSNLQLINSSSCWFSSSHASTGAVSTLVVNEHLNPVICSDNNNDINYNGIVNCFGGQGSSNSAPPSSQPFHWE